MNRFYLSLDEHIKSLSNLLKVIDLEKVEKLKNFISDSENLYVTGIGKNADLMYKISKTMNSVSIPTIFIDPVNACHGDFGMIKNNAHIIASSKSGTTKELVYFLQHVKKINKNIKVFLIHCNENLMEKYYDFDLYVPITREADHMNLIPTISLTTIEVILQSIICQIIEDNNFNKEKLWFNHPAGNLGRICE